MMKYFLLILLLPSFLGAEIPFQHALGLLSATKDSSIKIPNQKEPINIKDLSPFWAMVALHSGLIEQIRFYGNFAITKTKDGREIEEGKDVIAKLIKRLFNSPDGISLAATTYDNDPVGNLSRNLGTINNIVEVLITVSGKNKSLEIKEILDRVDPKLSKENEEFANLLVAAYNKQSNFNELYPKNIVVISLLSFFVKVANHKDDFKALSFLIDGNFLDSSIFTKDDYAQYKDIMPKTASSKVPQLDKNNDRNQELAFLMFKGFDQYEAPFSLASSYRDTRYAGQKFSDCGETSLKNLIAILASAYNGGIISLKTLEYNLKISNADIDLASHEKFNKILAYFRRFHEVSLLSSDEAHHAWAEVVSDINTYDHHLSQVIYSNKTHPQCELKSQQHDKIKGIINMFNLISKLIPDNVLNRPWSEDEALRYEEIKHKLDRLLMLFSDHNVKYAWKLSDQRDNITNEFPEILINANNNMNNYIHWFFSKGHYDLKIMINNTLDDDWRVNYAKDSIDFSNSYMAFLYLGKLGHLSTKYPMATLYHHKLKDVNSRLKVISFILEHHKSFDISLPFLWISKLDLRNEDLLNELAVLMIPYHHLVDNEKISKLGQEKITQIIKQIDELSSRHIFQIAVINGYSSSLSYLLSNNKLRDRSFNKPDLKYRYQQHNNLIHLAVKSGDINTLKILLAYGDDEHIDYQALLLSKNIDQEDPLIIAIKHEYVDILDLLFNKLPNIYQDEDVKKTLMHYLLHDQCIKSLRYLLDKKLFDINAVMFHNKATLLMMAVRFNYVSVVKFLLDYGADISIKDSNGNTALNHAKRNNDQMMINLLTKASSKE